MKNASSKTKRETWNDIKAGLKHSISGYMMRYGNAPRTKKNLDEIRCSVGMMFELARLKNLIYDYKIGISRLKDKYDSIRLHIEMKTTPRRKKTQVWEVTVENSLKRMEDELK